MWVALWPIEARWNFHIFPKFTAYGKLGLAIGAFIPSGFGPSFYYYFPAQVGVVYQLTKSIALRAEIGYPSIKIGLGFAF